MDIRGQGVSISVLAAHEIRSDCCLQSQFGLPETLYDFQGIDADVLKNKCDELEASTKGMKKKINPKVMSMIDRYFFCISVWSPC